MRTLDELLTMAKEANAEHAARVEALRQTRAEAEAAAEKASADASAALAADDQKAFENAKHAESYQRERMARLAKHEAAEHFTPEEHNAIVDEVNKALSAESAPLYDHLWEIIDEWNATIEHLNAKHGTARRVGIVLYNMLSAKAKNGSTSATYAMPKGGLTPGSVYTNVFDSGRSEVVKEMRHYHPRKEKTTDVPR